MQYEIERFNDPAFFTWLDSLGPHKAGTTHLFNKVLVCGYAAFDVLETWGENRAYLIPDLPELPSMVTYFFNSEGKRIFAAFIYGHGQHALLIEITIVQLAMLPTGVRTVSGKRLQTPVHTIISAPDDGKPINHQFIAQPACGAYLGVHEIERPADPFAVVTDGTMQVIQRKLLRLDIGHPLLAASHVNTHAGLLTLSLPGPMEQA